MNTTAALQPTTLLLPVAALALWTMLVLLLIPLARFKAGMAGQVTFEDFKYGESARVPASVSLPNRVFMNLLEVPVLFYAACLVAFVSGHADQLLLTLAWVYVALRLLHSLIYLSYNRVPHRLTVFASSNFVVATMWVIVGWRLWSA